MSPAMADERKEPKEAQVSLSVKLKLQNEKAEGRRGMERFSLRVLDVVFETKETSGRGSLMQLIM